MVRQQMAIYMMVIGCCDDGITLVGAGAGFYTGSFVAIIMDAYYFRWCGIELPIPANFYKGVDDFVHAPMGYQVPSFRSA